MQEEDRNLPWSSKNTMMGVDTKDSWKEANEADLAFMPTAVATPTLENGKTISFTVAVRVSLLGHYVFASGERYSGTLVMGSKEGYGVYKYMNGNVYDGEWKKDKKHGKGKYDYFLTGESYEGDWYMGEKRGEGEFTFSYGQTYKGGWLKNEKSGYGTITFQSGAIFEGLWQNVDLFHPRTRLTEKES